MLKEESVNGIIPRFFFIIVFFRSISLTIAPRQYALSLEDSISTQIEDYKCTRSNRCHRKLQVQQNEYPGKISPLMANNVFHKSDYFFHICISKQNHSPMRYEGMSDI